MGLEGVAKVPGNGCTQFRSEHLGDGSILVLDDEVISLLLQHFALETGIHVHADSRIEETVREVGLEIAGDCVEDAVVLGRKTLAMPAGDGLLPGTELVVW